jgi:hypothetical protein
VKPSRELKAKPPLAEVKPATAIEREFLDIPSAAEWAYVSPQHVRRLLTERKLTRFKFGARTLIKFSELRSLVQPDKA